MNFVLRARSELGLSQRDFARKIKSSQPSIVRYEQTGKIPLKIAKRLVKVFHGEYTLNDIYEIPTENQKK